ncbi:hypothetical protein HDF14_005342 [Edaphobacter lichenicola]|uniref:Uncharacterized protein n=1 Tax=Tunturiibacter gelidiferens TaxID=3069689 RepID=A0A9X0QK07_9BACT|nr:hypothetical protein [Edaphobacter lichenicola]
MSGLNGNYLRYSDIAATLAAQRCVCDPEFYYMRYRCDKTQGLGRAQYDNAAISLRQCGTEVRPLSEDLLYAISLR